MLVYVKQELQSWIGAILTDITDENGQKENI